MIQIFLGKSPYGAFHSILQLLPFAASEPLCTDATPNSHFFPTVARMVRIRYNPFIPDIIKTSKTPSKAMSWGSANRRAQEQARLRERTAVQQLNRYRFPHLHVTKPTLPAWLDKLPRVTFTLDPVINFKVRQRIQKFGTGITLGMDYLSDVQHWRMYCVVEDYIVGGRFSLRGTELGWTKSWLWNFGMGESSENGAKFKLRLGFNVKTAKAYARLRFRAEPISPFGLDIGEGITCAGKVPLPTGSFLPILRSVPLRVEYRLRVNSPRSNRRQEEGGGAIDHPATDADSDAAAAAAAAAATAVAGVSAQKTSWRKKALLPHLPTPSTPHDATEEGCGVTLPEAGLTTMGAHGSIAGGAGMSRYDDRLSLSTGIHAVDVSVDELNFCLEWDEHSPLWDIGLVTGGGNLWKPSAPSKSSHRSVKSGPASKNGRRPSSLSSAAGKNVKSQTETAVERERARMRAAQVRAAARAAAARRAFDP